VKELKEFFLPLLKPLLKLIL